MRIKAKKTLGQNFLRNRKILKIMREAAEILPDDLVVEVGPGEGLLTEELLKCGGKIIAIEKDDRFIPFLKEKFGAEISSGKLTIIHGDILEIDQNTYIKNSYKLIANLPYYITGKFLRKFLQSDNQPATMVLMLQKEVAKRIVAQDKKESLLSISVKTFGNPKYIQTVRAKEFSPAPKVDSGIIAIKNISCDFFRKNQIAEEKFFEIIKVGFAEKRKILQKKLLIFAPKEKLEEVYKKCNITEKSRAENLTLENWGCLAKNFN